MEQEFTKVKGCSYRDQNHYRMEGLENNKIKETEWTGGINKVY